MSKKAGSMRVGIDLGGTGIKIGIVNEAYDILAQTSVPTKSERPFEQIVADMGNKANELLKEAGLTAEDCMGIGIGSPGTIDSENGVVLYSNNIGWENVSLAEELRKYLPLPVFINNDANCAALGEVVKGAAKGCKNAVFFTLGTGVGGGIVLDGRIFEGGHPGGVELGHMTIRGADKKCTCGRTGCLEAYASATALIRDAKEAAALHPESMLWELCSGNLDQMNAKLPFDAAHRNDACGLELVNSYIEHLAEGIANVVNIFRPDVVVLGGGVCAQGEYLTAPVQEYLKKNCFGGETAFLPKVITAQNGNDAGIIGAAALVQEGGLSPF